MFSDGPTVFSCGVEKTNGCKPVKFMDLVEWNLDGLLQARNPFCYLSVMTAEHIERVGVKPGCNILVARLQIRTHLCFSRGSGLPSQKTNLLPSCWHCTLVYTSSLSKSLHLPLSCPRSAANAFCLLHSFSLTWNVSLLEPLWLWLTEEEKEGEKGRIVCHCHPSSSPSLQHKGKKKIIQILLKMEALMAHWHWWEIVFEANRPWKK